MVDEKLPEVRFAVIGESGCGKTTLLASYYGTLAGGGFAKDHGYSILAEDIGQGNELNGKFLGLNEGRFPHPDRVFNHYRFNLSLSGVGKPVLRISWFDYPGGWFTAAGETPEQESKRRKAIVQLLSCDVGFLVFDGNRVRDRQDGVKDMVRFLSQFRDNVRHHQQILGEMGQPFDGYPKEWVFVLSKADLFPDKYSARDFQEAVSTNAADIISELRDLFSRASGIGTRFLLLSSVKAEGDRIVDPRTSIGMNLVAPLAFLSTIRKIKGFPALGIKLLEFAASGVMVLQDALPLLMELLSLLPGGPVGVKILRKALDWLSRHLLQRPDDARKVAEKIRGMAKRLAKKGESLAAVCCTMVLELSDEHNRRLFLSLDQRSDESASQASLDHVVESWEGLSEEARREIMERIRKEAV